MTKTGSPEPAFFGPEVFLTSDAARFVTGASLVCHGGYTAQ
jgi:hypothetical protein